MSYINFFTSIETISYLRDPAQILASLLTVPLSSHVSTARVLKVYSN